MSRRYRRATGFDWSSYASSAPALPIVVSPAQLPEHRTLFDASGHIPALTTPRELETLLQVAVPDPLRAYIGAVPDWNLSPPRLSGDLPRAPVAPFIPEKPDDVPAPKWEEYEPRKPSTLLGALAKAFSGGPSYEQAVATARQSFRAATRQWEIDQRTITANRKRREDHEARARAHAEGSDELSRKLREATLAFESARDAYKASVAAERSRVAALRALARDGEAKAVEEVARLCWRASRLPRLIDRSAECVFDPEGGALLVTIQAPNLEYTPPVEFLKSGAPKVISDRTRKRCQEQLLYSLPLRLLHDLFSCPDLAAVALIGVNVALNYTDKADGHRKTGIVSTVACTRETFQELRVQEVDPKACFRRLKGLCVPSLDTIAPVPPVLRLDRNDGRIVAAQEVLETLETNTNLAAMDWDHFEHLVRELFEKMFSSRSPDAEVKVTRASRDWGVDAIVFDPDPIHGGKFVIQAKRYTNLVDVAAVRDLFGTVLNEGANRGYLVTTSGFGPEAREFAASKPLTLIDGANLLSLFERFGYRFSIDLAAAKAAAAAAQASRANREGG